MCYRLVRLQRYPDRFQEMDMMGLETEYLGDFVKSNHRRDWDFLEILKLVIALVSEQVVEEQEVMA